ncbi:hypothetical protein GGR60_003375 [Xanthomonas arboricola]|uniref:hypothetical protein n=1 Tax=Xanthomonas euroxanthea TaxID=2259622 RepID=UPI001430FE93|nr:hypothetical protein [Xanthomonas euroxanthea]NJC38821.1 hypothetical protein [Xanthomonas euroxanthea]
MTLLPPQQLFFLAITARLRHRKATPAGATSGLMMHCTIHACLDFDQLGSNGLWGKLGCWYVPEQTELIGHRHAKNVSQGCGELRLIYRSFLTLGPGHPGAWRAACWKALAPRKID